MATRFMHREEASVDDEEEETALLPEIVPILAADDRDYQEAQTPLGPPAEDCYTQLIAQAWPTHCPTLRRRAFGARLRRLGSNRRDPRGGLERRA